MKKNIGTIDKIVRILIAAIIAYLYLENQITGIVATLLLLTVVGVFTATSLVGTCPMYFSFGISTKKIREENN